jgi:hypothetical protein
MDNNTINSSSCLGTVGAGSNGFSGGLDVVGSTVNFLPFSAIPEPGSLALFGVALGLLTVILRQRSTSVTTGG